MKLMKNFSLTALLSLAMLGTVTFTSCSRDECKDVVCQNGGTCNEDDGSCACPTGYEGSLCETPVRNRFLGAYVGTEQCTIGSDAYTLTISANSDNIKMTVTNLYGIAFTAIGTVTGANTFSFNTTVGTVTANGTGTLNGNQIVVVYTIADGSNTNTCTFTGSK